MVKLNWYQEKEIGGFLMITCNTKVPATKVSACSGTKQIIIEGTLESVTYFSPIEYFKLLFKKKK